MIIKGPRSLSSKSAGFVFKAQYSLGERRSIRGVVLNKNLRSELLPVCLGPNKKQLFSLIRE